MGIQNRLKLVSAANHIMNDDPRRMWMYGVWWFLYVLKVFGHFSADNYRGREDRCLVFLSLPLRNVKAF